jgi:hypothetical protein
VGVGVLCDEGEIGAEDGGETRTRTQAQGADWGRQVGEEHGRSSTLVHAPELPVCVCLCAMARLAGPDDPDVLSSHAVQSLAAKHRVTPAQVALRWAVQRGTIPLPRSTNPARIAENLQGCLGQRESGEVRRGGAVRLCGCLVSAAGGWVWV